MTLLHAMVKLRGKGKYDLDVPTPNLVGRYDIVTEEYGTITCEVGVSLTELNHMACVCVPRDEVNEIMNYYNRMKYVLDFLGDLKIVDMKLYNTVRRRCEQQVYDDEEWVRKGQDRKN